MLAPQAGKQELMVNLDVDFMIIGGAAGSANTGKGGGGGSNVSGFAGAGGNGGSGIVIIKY